MLKRFFVYWSVNDVSLICIGLMFFLPFINMHHVRPLPVFYSEWVAALMGLVAIGVQLGSSVWLKLTHSIKIPQVSLIFVGLAAILCVQWALGILQSNQYALLALSYLTWAFLMVAIGGHLRAKLGLQKSAVYLAYCLVIAASVNVLIVVLQFVARTGGVVPFLPNLSSFGAVAQANHFASFISLGITSLIYLHAKGYFSKSFFYLLLILFIFLLSFSGSRSAWLYLITIIIFTYILRADYIKQEKTVNFVHVAKKTALWLLPMFALVQLFIYFVIPSKLVNLPTERLLDAVAAPSQSMRLQFWYDSIRIFLESPWLGVGTGKFMASTFLLIDTPTALSSKLVFEHAHNLFLHLLAEMGVVAVLIVFGGLFAWVKGFKWRALNLETWWLICLLSIISIHSLLEYPLWFAFFLGIFSVLLGFGDENTISIQLGVISKKMIRGTLALLLILGSVNLGTMLVANIKLENWIEKFTNKSISDVAELNWVRKYSLLSPTGQHMYALTMAIDSKHIRENLTDSQSVMSFRPNGIVAYQYALLLQLNCRHEDAIKQLNRALLAYPRNFKIVSENAPVEYRQEYLNLFSEVKQANTNKSNEK